jgi:succinylglutamic semialdehyde dehydrogenase
MHYIDGKWEEGLGEESLSHNPATGEVIWQGKEATREECETAIVAARNAFETWRKLSLEERIAHLKNFETNLRVGQAKLANTISKESGKPLWESLQEVDSMIAKIAFSIEAYQKYRHEEFLALKDSTLAIHYKPHGVVAVFGPFNFPGHLPNGHIVPALLAGNTIVFKGSELTPGVSELMIRYWQGLPQGVINLVQGGAKTGHLIATHSQIDGIFFTGSYATGQVLSESLKLHPEKMMALEMGGNNPLVVSEIADYEAAAYITLQSAFLTAGQRCSSARRLIIHEGQEGEEFLKVLIEMASTLRVGPYTLSPEPFMGPVITPLSAEKLLNAQATLGTDGGICLLEMRPVGENSQLLTPGIMDVSKVHHRKDEEIFGPFLQVIRVSSFEAAIHEANKTAYGLTAALLSRNPEKFKQFFQEVHAGIINWNAPTIGASSNAPFGGVGKSGNHRPSGSWAAHYCSYPIASLVRSEITLPEQLLPGIDRGRLLRSQL